MDKEQRFVNMFEVNKFSGKTEFVGKVFKEQYIVLEKLADLYKIAFYSGYDCLTNRTSIENGNITLLNLGSLYINDQGLDLIAELKHLKDLNLSENRIKDHPGGNNQGQGRGIHRVLQYIRNH